MKTFGKANFPVAFRPTSAFPLDARCVFADLASAEAAAKTAEEIGSTNTIYHYGMQLLVSDSEVDKWYIIQRDGTLLPIGSGEETSEVVILEEQEIAGFTLNQDYGYTAALIPAPFTLVAGETYRVLWGKDLFEVVAVDAHDFLEGAILLGNGTSVDLPGNGEPFAMGCTANDVTIFAFDDPAEAHTVAIYQTMSVQSMPPVTAADNDKIMQVVNGVWTKVSVAESAVKSFVDDYINSALEGDY